MKVRAMLLAGLSMLMLFGLPAVAQAAPETFVVTQLTTNDDLDRAVQVSGDRIVWEQRNGENPVYEIYTWTPSGGTIRLSDPDGRNQHPRVSGDRVVWEDMNASILYTWTPSGGVVDIASHVSSSIAFRVSGDRVVWVGDDLVGPYTWTPQTGVVQLGAGYCMDVCVSGDRVAWSSQADLASGSPYQVYTWTPAAGTLQLTDDTEDLPHSVEASGDRIAWSDWGTETHRSEVFTWTPASGRVQLTNDEYADGVKGVSGDRVLWHSINDDGSVRGVYTWTSATGTIPIPFQTDGLWELQLSGDRVVSTINVTGGESGFEVFTWTPQGGVVRVTSNAVNEGGVQVSGDRIVWYTWQSVHTGDAFSEIYTAVSGVSATRYEQTDSHIVKTGDWTDFSKPGLASADSYGRSLTPGASATVYFEGTQIDYIAMTGSTPGLVDIYLDAAFQETIDLYSSPAAYDQKVWSSGVLTDGPHKLELKRNDTSLSTEYLTLDALDIWGTIATAPVPVTPTRYEQTDSRIVKVGAWIDFSKPGLASADSYGRSLTPGASATVYFEGTRIDYIAMTGSTPGLVDIYLDDIFKETIDLYSLPAVYNQTIWSSGTLADGAHKLELKRNDTSLSTEYLTLDALDIWGTIADPPPPGPTRYEQTDSHIVKTGDWTDFSKPGLASADSYGRSLTPGASATVYFEGTRIDYVAMTGSTPGIVDIYLDDVFQETIDLYSSPAAYDQTIWSSGTLTDGSHKLQLVRSDTSLSTEYLTLDALDIWGTIASAP